MMYDLTMIVLTCVGVVGTVWSSFLLHKTAKTGKVKVVG
jgi:hypothetical protein